MEIKPVVLVLADISGYTRFMRMHTMSVLHAEAIITDLLEAVINRAQFPLTLSKLEGDAAFLYVSLAEHESAQKVAQDVLAQVVTFFDAFKEKERELIACDGCRCDACNNINQLKLKAFVHSGRAVFKQIRQFEELAGEDVILIHRLLKNTIEQKEYILLTQAFSDLSGGLADRPVESRVEDCGGIGQVAVKVYYPVKEDLPLPVRPDPGPPIPGTVQGDVAYRFNTYAVKRMNGQITQQFSHLPAPRLGRFSIMRYFVGGIGGNIISGIRFSLGRKS